MCLGQKNLYSTDLMCYDGLLEGCSGTIISAEHEY